MSWTWPKILFVVSFIGSPFDLRGFFLLFIQLWLDEFTSIIVRIKECQTTVGCLINQWVGKKYENNHKKLRGEWYDVSKWLVHYIYINKNIQLHHNGIFVLFVFRWHIMCVCVCVVTGVCFYGENIKRRINLIGLLRDWER